MLAWWTLKISRNLSSYFLREALSPATDAIAGEIHESDDRSSRFDEKIVLEGAENNRPYTFIDLIDALHCDPKGNQ